VRERGSARQGFRGNSPGRGISIVGQRFMTGAPFDAGGRDIVTYPELHRHDLGADRDRLVDDPAGRFGPAEGIDHILEGEA